MKTKTALLTGSAITLCAYAAADAYKNLSITYPPKKPKTDENHGLIHKLLLYMDNPQYAKKDGVTIDNNYIVDAVTAVKKYIDGRYDCADFRMQSLLRLLYLYGDEIKKISPDGYNLIHDALLGEKFWMTEPGSDSACYWSENHQLLFAVAEYLTGQMWQEEKFFNDNATGKEHMERARKRINYWMDHRFKYGYTEFNSSNYFLFDLGPASNFIQFASPEDAVMVERMKICIDLLIYDISSNMFKFDFTAPTARAYADNMTGGDGDRVRQLTDYIWKLNDNYKTSTHHMLINFISMMNAKDKKGKALRLYEIPEVLIKIGSDRETKIVKASTGLNVSELPEKGYVGHSDEQIMMQFGMESFTNPEVIYNTVTYLKKNGMFANSFLNYFKVLGLKALESKSTLEFISKKLNPMPNGIAQQRANLYTYRTPDYQLSCVQKYHPGSYGAQQMLSVLNFGSCVVFTTHPARCEEEKTVKATPGYWPGFGRAPHIAQFENVQLQLFKIPKISGFLELYKVPQFTHTYLPEMYFDEVRISGRFAFAKKDNAFLALIGANELKYNEFSEISANALGNNLAEHPDKRFDLIQEGNNQFWIYELSSEDNESFEAFISRIKLNPVVFSGTDSLVYKSAGKEYELVYNGDFKVDSKIQATEYKRFDSDFITAEREADTFRFSFKGSELTLDYNKAERKLK